MKHITQLFTFLALLVTTTAWSAEAEKTDELEALSKKIKTITYKLDRGIFDQNDLAAWTKVTIKLSGEASVCIADNEAKIKKAQESIDALGEKVKDEAAEVTKQRDKLQKEKEQLDKALAKCNLYKQNSDKASEHISLAEKSYFKEKYLIRGPHIYRLAVEYLESPFEVITESGTFFWKHAGIQELDATYTGILVATVALMMIIGLWIRGVLRRLEQRIEWIDDFSEHLAQAALTTIAQFLPWLLAAAIAAFTLSIATKDIKPTPFITTLSVSLLFYLVFIATVRFIFSPVQPAKTFIDFTPGIAVKLSRRLHILAMLTFVGYMAFYTVFSESIPESNRLLLRDIFSLLFVLNLIWLFMVLVRSPKLANMRWLLIVMIMVFAISLAAEWIGYRNLGLHGRRSLLLTFIILAVFMTLSKLFRDLFNAMDDGTYEWCKRLRTKLAVEDNKNLPGLVWIRLLTTIVIWGGFAYILLSSWDQTGSVIQHLRNYIVHGFQIVEFRIVPSKILLSIFVLAIIISSTGWIKRQLESNWLPKTTMERGAREAMVTITGYVMFVIAALAALSVAGFDFSNIAIIAGALSVGIGFGLQNIVNNFVSGLILLFERPIRKGDWIQVGTTEGYVQDIRIRSTRIVTFDRSDVIVPNSELISNQVTNFMLGDVRGRAIVRVGVAYGSDTEKVRYILSQVAEENDLVVKDGSSPRPMVLFRGFGDSSLDFELRVHLYDVDRRLSTISNLNFAIDKAFREEGIEIPFPQRDVHVKTLPDKKSED
ncbi:MAG: mechanosensitive ion channel [Thiotrichales bacterium]|nr:MAG: mechanosensitive ion channel [Thiotrichales bacterium]